MELLNDTHEEEIQATAAQEQEEITETEEQTQQPDEEEKTFTQEEVNEIVKKRLARERVSKDSTLEAREKDLELREKALEVREMRVKAEDILEEIRLPERLIEIMDLENGEESFNRSLEWAKGFAERFKDQHELIRAKGHTPKVMIRSQADPVRSAFGLK